MVPRGEGGNMCEKNPLIWTPWQTNSQDPQG